MYIAFGTISTLFAIWHKSDTLLTPMLHMYFFGLCHLEIRQMTSQKHREPYFHTPRGYVYNFIATLKQPSGIAHIGAAIRNCSHWSCLQELLTSDQNCRFSAARENPKVDRWRTKVGHLFYATSSFVHHFVNVCQLKLGNFCFVLPWKTI